MVNGIVLYDIELDGCLNGVYTNDGPGVQGVIYNEVARKKKTMPTGIAGDYDCFYFDISNARHDVDLTITPGPTRTFDFLWAENSKPIFCGVGYLMNERQIAVRYWDV